MSLARSILAGGVLLGTVLFCSGVAVAQPSALDRILPAVARQVPGTTLDARGPVPSSDGSLRYEIKWLRSDGLVLWLTADAKSGRISR